MTVAERKLAARRVRVVFQMLCVAFQVLRVVFG